MSTVSRYNVSFIGVNNCWWLPVIGAGLKAILDAMHSRLHVLRSVTSSKQSLAQARTNELKHFGDGRRIDSLPNML